MLSFDLCGLKEIKFINSGHFPHESIMLDDFALLLGSSGVGKTTIMSAVCYFYTMDKDKTRPDSKEYSFYDWHLETGYSHVIYIYENKIGKNLLVLSKEKQRVRHTFINVQNYAKDISALYLDENNQALTIEEILANCVKENLAYYKCETTPTFRKMMCKRSYNLLPKKDKPELDFSIFDSESTANMYGKYLFSIYSNSSVRDKSVKDMLISLVGETQHALNIFDFREKLKDAIKNIEHFDLIKSKRKKILELDNAITAYKALCNDIDQIKLDLETIFYNREEIKKNIKNKLSSSKALYHGNKEKEEKLENERRTKKRDYYSQTAKLNESIDRSKETYENFTRKNNINVMIEEEGRKEDYESQLNELRTKLSAATSSIEGIEEREKIEKEKMHSELNKKKEEEKKELEKTKEALSSEIIELLEHKDQEVKEGTFRIDQDIESLLLEYTELNNEIIRKESTLKMLPAQDLTSTPLKNYEQTINRFVEIRDSIKEKDKTLQSEIEHLTAQRKDKLEEIESKISNEASVYTERREALKEKIEKVDKQLDMGKENLFGFLNRNEVANKRKILALANEEILFEEKGLGYSLEKNNDNFYGLKIDGNIEAMASKYDIETLENQRTALHEQLKELIAKYQTRHKHLEEELRTISTRIQKQIREKTRETYILFPQIKDYEIKINNEKKRKEEELKRLKDEHASRIISMKDQLTKDKTHLSGKKRYLDAAKTKKNNFLTEIDDKYEKKIDILREKLRACKKSIDTINEKYQSLMENSNKKIHDAFNEIKKSKNIDTDKIDFYNQNISKFEKLIGNINNNVSLVLRYKDEILPNFDQIPFLEKQCSALEEEYEIDMERLKNKKNSISDEIKENENEMKVWSDHLVAFENFETEISQFDMNPNKGYDSFAQDEIIGLLNSKKYLATSERYNTLITQQEGREKNIIFDTLKIIDNIPADNMMKLKTKSDISSFEEDIEQYIVVAKSYAEFVKTKFDIEGTSLQLHRLIEAINSAVSTISYIKGNFQSILKNVHKINASIAEGVKNITVIDFIRLNFRDMGQDEIVTKIENIGDMLNANMLLGYEKSDRSEALKDELIRIAQDLQGTLEKTFKKEITVSDISSLTFDVSENSQITKGIATLENIGSNGTSIMVKTIIYITLLHMVTKKMGNNQDMRYHCIIDEIGQISADYFTELMNYAKYLGFVFLNGTAANDDDMIDAYPKIYMGTREGPRHVELSLIDAKDAMEGW